MYKIVNILLKYLKIEKQTLTTQFKTFGMKLKLIINLINQSKI